MAGSALRLDDLRVASPCTASWASMAGSERVRYCDSCGLHVYNLSAMSREEAEALIIQKEGRLCVRFFRRNDGTLMTRDCPIGLRALRWPLRILLGLAATIFVIGFGFASHFGSARSRTTSIKEHEPFRKS